MRQFARPLGRCLWVVSLLFLPPLHAFSEDGQGGVKETQQEVFRMDMEKGVNPEYPGTLLLYLFEIKTLPHARFYFGQIRRSDEHGRAGFFGLGGVDLNLVDSVLPFARARGLLDSAPYVKAGIGLARFDRKTELIGTLVEAHLFLNVGAEALLPRTKLFWYLTLNHWSNGRGILGNLVPGPNKGEEFLGWGIGVGF